MDISEEKYPSERKNALRTMSFQSQLTLIDTHSSRSHCYVDHHLTDIDSILHSSLETESKKILFTEWDNIPHFTAASINDQLIYTLMNATYVPTEGFGQEALQYQRKWLKPIVVESDENNLSKWSYFHPVASSLLHTVLINTKPLGKSANPPDGSWVDMFVELVTLSPTPSDSSETEQVLYAIYFPPVTAFQGKKEFQHISRHANSLDIGYHAVSALKKLHGFSNQKLSSDVTTTLSFR